MAARIRLSDADCWAQAGASFMAGEGETDLRMVAGAFPAAPQELAIAPRDVWYVEQTRYVTGRCRSRRAVSASNERERTR